MLNGWHVLRAWSAMQECCNRIPETGLARAEDACTAKGR